MKSDRKHKIEPMTIDSEKASKYDLPRQSLQRKRCCTDIPCCILFVLFIIAFVILSIFAFLEGDPRQLIHPTDSQGNLCGTGNLQSKPYLYFFDWTKCIHALNIPVNLLQGRPFVCPTTQVCVEQCPNQTSYYEFENYFDHRVCTYDAEETKVTYKDLVAAGKCASYVMASKPLFGRCVPEHLANMTNSIIYAPDGAGHENATVWDSNGKPLNGSKLEEGVKYLVELLNLKQISTFLVEDFTKSWQYILLTLSLSAIISFIWIVLMRWLAKPIVWLAIILFILLLAIITGLAFFEFTQLRSKNNNEIVKEFQFVADMNYYRNLPLTWLIVGIISAVFLLISVLILFAIFKRLRIALAVLTEASKAVGYNFFSLFWPFVPFLLEIGIVAYWAVVAVYLSTAGKPIYRITFNETIANSTDQAGQICNPNKWNNSDGTQGDCVFWEYGYDPNTDLDSILNGTGKHFDAFIRFVNQNQWLPQLFALFMFFWLTAFVIGLSQLVLAGIYARYYWNRKHIGLPCSSIIESFLRAFVFHLGTVAFGSLIIAIVKLIRVILEYIEKKTKEKTGKIARCVFCCCRCCLFCLEKFLKFLNRNAYIITAIYGTGFLTSARRAFKIIISNPLRLLVIDKVCDFLIFLGKLCITAGIGILAFFFFTGRISLAKDYVPELHYYFVPLLLIIIGTYIITTCFFSVYSMAVDTLFICALEDLRLHDKNPNHDMQMPKGMRKVFKVKDKK